MGRDMNTILLWLVVIIALVAIGPLLTIWSFNTLFPVLAIPYALDTWAAVVLLGIFIRANVTVKK
jgi:hypothetical protein